MADVIFVAILFAFFGVTVAFVKGCERIVGPDVSAETITPAEYVEVQETVA